MPKGDNFRGRKSPNSGIKKGQPNRKSKEWKEFSEVVLSMSLPKVEAYMRNLEGKEFFDAFLSILNYLRPKYASIEAKTESTIENKTLTIEYVKPMPEAIDIEPLNNNYENNI